MFGNLQGWLLAIVFAGVVAWQTWTMTLVPAPTRPTGFPNLLAPIALPPGHETLVPPGTDPGDAGPLYREAADLYRRSSPKYKAFRENEKERKLENVPGLPAVELVMRGSKMKTMTLFRDKPGEVLNYQGSSETVDALKELAGVLDTIGSLHRVKAMKALEAKNDAEAAKHFDAGEPYFRALFSMGRHLFNERVGYEELSAGGGMIGKACVAMLRDATLRGDKAREAEVERWSSDYQTYMGQRVTPIVTFLRGVDRLDGRAQAAVASHAGDTILLARQSQEPMWRAEALLKMGRMKFNAATKGDQIAAQREIPKYLNDKDPAVRVAAQAADKLTIDEYKMIH